MAKNNAKIIPEDLYLSAGIDRIQGLPTRLSEKDLAFKNGVRIQMRITDEQDAVNSITWYDFPDLRSQELERLLYIKGSVALFYYEPLEKFYAMPYVLDGTLDFYGRFNEIHCIPMFDDGKDNEFTKRQRPVLSMYKLKVYHEVPNKRLTWDEMCHAAVIIRDYTPQLSQTIIPRKDLNDPLIETMSEILPMLRTALRNATGVEGMRVGSQDEQISIQYANASVDRAVLNGQRWIPIVGQIDFQSLSSGSVAKAEEYLLTLQSMDNYRLGTHGLKNGGLFQKKTHVLQDEQNMNVSVAGSILADRLSNRQTACDIANAIWGLGVSCEASETALELDMFGDGAIDNGNDQSGLAGNQPAVGGVPDDE